MNDCLMACVHLDEITSCLGIEYIDTVSSNVTGGSLCRMMFDVTQPSSSSSSNIAILQLNNQTAALK